VEDSQASRNLATRLQAYEHAGLIPLSRARTM
jgi:hypothetical protein